MTVPTPVDTFTLALAQGKHDFSSDTIRVALCNAANAPVASNAVLADLTEIANYTNMSSRALTGVVASQTLGNLRITANDLALSMSSGTSETFRYVVLYNDSSVNKEIIAFYDNGSDVSIVAGGDPYLVDITPANGFVQFNKA